MNASRFQPHRAHRSDWWATWKGQDHAVGHFNYIDWKALTYTDNDWGNAMKMGRGQKGLRGQKVVDLIKQTGIILIQRNGSDNRAFDGWHSAWKVEEFQSDEELTWFQFKLGERLA